MDDGCQLEIFQISHVLVWWQSAHMIIAHQFWRWCASSIFRSHEHESQILLARRIPEVFRLATPPSQWIESGRQYEQRLNSLRSSLLAISHGWKTLCSPIGTNFKIKPLIGQFKSRVKNELIFICSAKMSFSYVATVPIKFQLCAKECRKSSSIMIHERPWRLWRYNNKFPLISKLENPRDFQNISSGAYQRIKT